jgi:hypothetical protein
MTNQANPNLDLSDRTIGSPPPETPAPPDEVAALKVRLAQVAAERDAASAPNLNNWTCFHCGETFTTFGGARDHFGTTPNAEAGCLIRVKLGDERGLQMELRKAEARADACAARLTQVQQLVAKWTDEIATAEREREQSSSPLGRDLSTVWIKAVTGDRDQLQAVLAAVPGTKK